MFRGSVKSTGYSLHSLVSPSLHLPCVTVCHDISTGLYWPCPALVFVRPLTAVIVSLHLTLQYASGLPVQNQRPLSLSGLYIWWRPVGYVTANSADLSSCLLPAFCQKVFRQYSVVESQPSASYRGDTCNTSSVEQSSWRVNCQDYRALVCRVSHVSPLKDCIWRKSGFVVFCECS